MNPEFDNLLRLLASTDEANVRLGLQLARNYTAEIEAHFGYSLQELEALFDFLMQYEAWDFSESFWEITHLRLEGKGLTCLPAMVGLLSKLTFLVLGHNELTDLPAELQNLQSLDNLQLFSNQFSTFPAVLTRLPNLQELNLASNPITVLPAEIGELPLSANIKM